MPFRVNPIFLSLAALALSALPVFGQNVVTGTITDSDSKAVAGAVVTFDRVDINGHLQVKSDKKGRYTIIIDSGPYNVSVTVDGQVREKANNIHIPIPGIGSNPPGPLDIKLNPPVTPAVSAALTAPPEPQSAPQQKGKSAADDDKAVKEREAQLLRGKELNDAYAAGKTAVDNKQWDEAVSQLTKASELGPTQSAVWSALADALTGGAKAAKAADAVPLWEKSWVAYKKLIELKPGDPAVYNNYALALAAGRRLDEAKATMAKAIELDPAGAGKYHYNLGALLMNNSQTDGALDEFKKAMDADANFAESYYFYGSTLVGRATLDQSTGKMIAPAGTVEALQKYLELQPNGPNADSAKALLGALGASVQVNYKDPNAPVPGTAKKPAK